MRWWLPLVGVLVGAFIGLLLAVSGGSVWRAQTIVYLGQPFAPLGGGQIQSLATNPRTVGEIIRSQATLEAASKASGIPVSRLRSSISTKELVAVGQARGINPLMEIAVKGSGRHKTELAADVLARRVTDNVSLYVKQKIDILEQQVATSEAQLAAVTARIDAAQRQQDGPGQRPLDPARPAPAPLREPELGHHHCRRTPHVAPGRPLRGAAAPEPRRERRVEPRGRARCRGEDDRSLEPDVAHRGRLHRPHRGADRRDRGGADPRAPARRRAQPGLMFDGKRVAVVVPAYDEEALVVETLRGIPELVDKIYVVDDASSDATGERAKEAGDPRVEVIRHERNRGVGAAIVTGYERALEDGIDVACVMAGDNQMDPQELQGLVEPVARGEVEYAKANRLVSGEAWKVIPRTRYLGNAVLSLLTKIASGYWHVADSQAGYTAISRGVLERLDLDRLYPRYGFPNDLLVHLNVENARVRDVPSRPIYDVGEQSGIRLRSVVPRISWLLFKAFWWRMGQKYVIRDFHPLVFFYVFGVLMATAGFVLGVIEVVLRAFGNQITAATIVLVAVLFIAGLQLTLFAMWFDMEANKELR